MTYHICFTTKISFSIMTIAEDSWELIIDAVKNKTLTHVCEIYRTRYLEYTDVSLCTWNLLHLSSFYGKLDIVRFCVEEKGLDVDSRDLHENTALHWAARKGHLQVVQDLLSSGADVNMKNKYGYTALHEVAHWGALQVIQHLLSSGADVNMKNIYGYTALHLAAREGHRQVVVYLAVNGADLTGITINFEPADVEEHLSNYWDEISLQGFDFLSDILNTASKEATEFEKVNAEMNKKLAEIIEATPDFANDPKNSLLFYRGHLYKNLVELYVNRETENDKSDATLLKTIYVALQSKISCDSNQSKDGENNQSQGNENKKLEVLLGDNLSVRFEKKIKQTCAEQVEIKTDDTDRLLIARKIRNEFIGTKDGCFKAMEAKLTNCWKGTSDLCITCAKCCLEKMCPCELPSIISKLRLPHECKTKGNFAFIACFLAVWVYMLDLITDFTVGYEDYNGFSKKLGIFEMFLVVFTLMHENIRSSMSLFSTEEELLRIKLGKEVLHSEDWKKSELVKNDNPFIQFLIMTFWPFAVRKKDGCLKCFKAVVYNLLTVFQLRPVVDRLRVLMHSPTNLRVIYRHRTEQDSLKQFYLITEQLPELLIQFYTLQIFFNIAGGAQSGDNHMFSDCGSGHNFSYPRFTDSLNNPDKRNWFCNEIPINSLVCDIMFRLVSAMIPFFMIPSGIVSLEVGFRLLDAATPKMSAAVQYLLQAAYTLMIPARLLMFAALMHALPIKEIIFGYVLLRVALELSYNLFTLGGLCQFLTTNVSKQNVFKQRYRSRVKKMKGCLSKLYKLFNTVWRVSMFSIRDVFAVSIREPQAYMGSPSNATYHSIRNCKMITVRCFIFLVEGLVGAWIIEEFYPCGRHSEIFRYIGWMCLTSLLLSVTVMTLISDLLHPHHLFHGIKNALRSSIISTGVIVGIGIVSSLVFIHTKHRTFSDRRVLLKILLFVMISVIVIVVFKLFTIAKATKDENKKESKNKSRSCRFCSCCLGRSTPYDPVRTQDEESTKKADPQNICPGEEPSEVGLSDDPTSSSRYENSQC